MQEQRRGSAAGHLRRGRGRWAALVRQVVRLIPSGAVRRGGLGGGAGVPGARPRPGVPISFLTRDPRRSPTRSGAWAPSPPLASSCGRRRRGSVPGRGAPLAAPGSGAGRGSCSPPAHWSLLLTLDDAFLLHEEMLPSAGVPEVWVYAGYLALGALYAVAFFRELLATDYVLLAAFVLCFAASLAIDNVFQSVSIFTRMGSSSTASSSGWPMRRTALWRVREGSAPDPTAPRRRPSASTSFRSLHHAHPQTARRPLLPLAPCLEDAEPWTAWEADLDVGCPRRGAYGVPDVDQTREWIARSSARASTSTRWSRSPTTG